MSTDRDTAPMPLDGHGSRTDRAALRLVESAGWKVTTNLVNVVLVPLILWGLMTVADQLKSIDKSINAFTTQGALTELRMQRLEADNARQDSDNTSQNADIRALQNKQASIEFRLESLRGMRPGDRTP